MADTRRPVPVPDPVSEPFWAAARERRLVVQRCSRCSAYQHPPGPVCRRCTSTELAFPEVSGRGIVYSFTVTQQAFVEGFDGAPLGIVLVELDEQNGLRMLGDILDTPLASLAVGMPVHVVFEEIGNGVVLPQFAATAS